MRSRTICVFALSFGVGCSEATIEIPEGTQLSVSLENVVRSDASHPGDEVVARMTEPVEHRSKVVLPAGTRVRGVVTSATPAGSGDPATLAIEFRQLEDRDGKTLSIDTHPIRLVSRESDAQPAARAALVDVDPGGHAAVVGGAVAPQEGVLTSGHDIALHPGQRILFRLDTPLRVRTPVAA